MAVGYKKTELGTVAVTERGILPDPKLRTLLILVDGKKSREDLLRMASALGDVEVRLQTLLSQGWIEEVQIASAKPAVTTAGPSVATVHPASASTATPTLEDVKRLAVRQLTELIGPTAEYFAVKIESAKTDPQLRLYVEKAAESVMSSHGRARALAYYNGIVSKLSQP
ncbi:MAG: hypothetical protein RLZZ271_12 [Pseudomonadota bacterium]